MRRLAGLAVVLLLITLGGCGMSTNDTGSGTGRSDTGSTTGSLVKDHRATLDFTTRPTRAAMGMDPDAAFISYPTGGSRTPIEATLKFPDGDVHGTFFEIDLGTNAGFGPDPDLQHEPKYFDIFQHVPDAAAAQSLLHSNAVPLGLRSQDIDELTGEGTNVLQGLIDDWLSVQVQVRARDDGSLNVIYSVAVDVYHNDAVDKVVADGTMPLDVRTRPTRADLAFLATYPSADVVPEPAEQLGLALTTATGTVTLPADRVASDADGDTPTSTVVSAVLTRDQATQAVRAAAPTLGYDAQDLVAFLADTSQDFAKRDVECTATDVYTCALRVTTTTSAGPGKQAALRLTLTYR